jgi:GT2 family glycosyltransferase/glycosyltransferase involved in cell wall biosynthesis
MERLFMSDLPAVTIVVLNYNGLVHLEDCFSSVTQLDYPPDRLELMLVDNASTDGSVEYVQTHYPQVRIVRCPENRGLGAGNNVGARETTSPYVVFLNNDMRVLPQFVHGMLQALQSDPLAVCASAKILNWDGTRFDFAGSASHFAGHAYPVAWEKPFRPDQFTKVEPTLFPCGGAMLIDRQVFLDVGGFDESYFIYYDDLDLGWRLWLFGYNVVFAPDAIAYHRHRGTMRSFSDYRKRVLYKRNALYSVLKNYSDEYLGRILPAILLARVDYIVEEAERRGRLDISTYYIRGTQQSSQSTESLPKEDMSTLVAIHDVVQHLPQVMEQRRFVQERRRRSDQEIAPLFGRPFLFWEDVHPETQYRVADAFDIQTLFEDLPRRVLVISSDILPYPGMPTVGSGLRAWGIGQGLMSRGHDVVFSMPRAALTGREDITPPEVAELAWEPHTLATVVRTAEPDVVIVCNWPVLDLLPTEHVGVPIILDQHGPHYMEREHQRYGDPDDNARRKLNALQKADFFTCAGEKQLAYFQAWLERAGWTEQERRERAAAMPVSLSPDIPAHQPGDELTFVYGGTFLPWQDPSLGLSTLVAELDRRNQGRLCFFGGKHPFYPVDPGIFETLLSQLQTSPHVTVPGMVSRDELIAAYTRAHVAMDLMKRNPERELAFTTRTVEYLWCGLPVIYNDYSELSDYIRAYNAGWLVDPEDQAAIVAVLDEIFEHPEQVIERGQNAQRLVRERLTWDKTITPVDAFVRRPRMRPHEIPRERPTVRNMRYLLHEARLHYQRYGLRALIRQSVAFVRRQWHH